MVHFLALFFCVITPIFSWMETKKLKENYSDSAKETTYARVQLSYWIAVILILFLVPLNELIVPKYDLPLNWFIHAVVWVLITYELATAVLPIFLIKYSEQLRAKVLEEYNENKRAVYPVTERQQWRFLFVAVSVGIGEEIIFRGFLYNYLQDYYSLGMWTGFMTVTIYFAAGHFHQGRGGIVNAFKLALIFGYLYFLTGSLLVPIVVHIFYDMKIVWLARILETHKTTHLFQ